MSTKSRKYQITWPLTADSAANIDEMFDELYRHLNDSVVGTGVIFTGETKGSLLYISDTAGTVDGLEAVATGKVLISQGVLTAPAYGLVTLTTMVTGVLPIANGGTNSSAALSGSTIMISNGTSIIQGAAGTTTTVLHGNAAGAPTYSAVDLTTDVSNDLPFSSLVQIATARILGRNTAGTGDVEVLSTIPSAVQDNITRTGTLVSGATGAGYTLALGTSTLTGDLPFANFVQASAASRLVGRGSAAGAGDYEEITIGTGLTMTATTLSASAGTNALLDGVAHTDTVAQTVSRGSLIYGNSTPKWDELVIGAAGRLLKSDGTDASWSTLAVAGLSDGSNVALLNAANTFTNAGSQTIQGTLKFDTSVGGVAGPSIFNNSNTLAILGGTSGIQINTQNNGANLLAIDNSGVITFQGANYFKASSSVGFRVDNNAGSVDLFIITNAGQMDWYLANAATQGTMYATGGMYWGTSPSDPGAGKLTVKNALRGGTLTSDALTSGRVTFASTNGLLVDDADMTFATDTLTVTKIVGSTSITDSGLTAGRVTFAGTAGLLSDDADMTFATDTLTVTKIVVGGGASVAKLDHGTYTPTLTNTANLSSSAANVCQYLRVGNTVTVSGSADIDPTLTATQTTLDISLPIASNFTNLYDCGGAAACISIAGMCAGILANTTGDTARMSWISTDINAQTMYFSFTYRVL